MLSECSAAGMSTVDSLIPLECSFTGIRCIDSNGATVTDSCTDRYLTCVDGKFSDPMPVAGIQSTSLLTPQMAPCVSTESWSSLTPARRVFYVVLDAKGRLRLRGIEVR